MNIYSINLTDGQKNKIKNAYKRKSNVTIQLSTDQIKTGNDKIGLNDRQKNSIDKHRKNNTGMRLTLTYKQLQENHKGGILPILAAIGALVGGVGGGAAAVANAVVDYKDKKAKREEMARHNKALEKIQEVIHGIKQGSGLSKVKKKALTNVDLENYAKKMKIKHFRGVFMKDELLVKPWEVECGIINLENSYQIGSHWTAYFKHKNIKYYFDSYGNAKPPIQLTKYLGCDNLYYNYDQIQQFSDPPICGYLCLDVLQKLSRGDEYNKILYTIKKNE